MKIEQILSPEHSQYKVQGVSKKRVLEYLSTFLNDADGSHSDADAIYQKLLERERLGSTGIGHGVAIPHCRVKNCTEITGALLKLTDKVDFDAIDGEPVDLIFALIVPEEHNQEHLEALSAIAELMQEESYRNKLRSATSNRELYNLAIAPNPS
ncbi:MAG: PTS IIA-like nitrogen regulatory protein PtsN [Porticoccaceae bacterium]|nr:PTS IIA-like nitrogen regulatory protein PtsN [Porticoccaceae bacterium]